jgi:hemophore-related protein
VVVVTAFGTVAERGDCVRGVVCPLDCSAGGVANTVSTTTGAARDYLDAHPGANQVVTAAYHRPRSDAAANIRGYFIAKTQDY